MGFKSYDPSSLRITDTYTHGWGNYQDAATSITPITVVGGTPELLVTDGLGALTDESYLPSQVTTFFNTSTSRVQLSGLNLGDIFSIRHDIIFTPNVSNSLLKFDFKFYNSIGTLIFSVERFVGFIKTNSIPKEFITSTPFFIGPDLLDGEVEIDLVSDTNGSLVINGVTVFSSNIPLG